MLNRLELVGETLRAALNELATVAPDWLRDVAPEGWYKRYARRVEDGRLPRAAAEREAYARTVGEDGFALLDRLDEPATPEGLRPAAGGGGAAAGLGAPLRAGGRGASRAAACGSGPRSDPPPAAEPVESPYDPEARFRTRSGTSWTGYIVHLSETCEDDAVHLITHAMTTIATVHEARCTAAIHRALAGKGLVAGRAPGGRGLRRRRAAGARPRGAGHRPGRPAAAEPVLAGQGRGRLHDRPLRGRLGRASGCAARRGSCPRPGARRSTTPARPTSR